MFSFLTKDPAFSRETINRIDYFEELGYMIMNPKPCDLASAC
jgi:hypothetical protein